MKEALLYEPLENAAVKCRLCRHECKIEEGKRGICGVRENQGGRLYSLVYDKVVSSNVDPIEKKPLFHVAPGSRSFSIATVGCNFRCSFCQNFEISQMPHDKGTIAGEHITPKQIVSWASGAGCRSIAYTYTEPTIFYELARETMEEAHAAGMLNVFVTNGYMSRAMLDDSKGLLDAANVDLKAFRDSFYTRYCKGRLEGVKDTLRYMKQLGIWVEVTTLLIPGLNDDPAEVRELAQFLHDDLGPETPWHISRFYPRYKVNDIPPTNVGALREVRQVGLGVGLKYVYSGNVPGDPGEKTLCPGCAAVLIDRVGYSIRKYRLDKGQCPDCGQRVEGLEM
ncbi:MAG: AmmeMemoRadiSam system radical SAM enzyme [Thermodesulfobacteriota bacterium]